MSKLLSPMELYHAARETCVRLYVANGGNKRDQWEIRPYPGTAAISRSTIDYTSGVSKWVLCMPSLPLDIRLPRWKADLIGAYTVHELLHALWTDWAIVKQSRIEHLHSLCNALEDNRIEWKANSPALVMVTEARRLLEALNDHIAKRALNAPGFTLDDPKQFSFVLNLVIFHEHHRYVSPFPANWRDLVRPEWLPMIDLALVRFPSLQSTGDVLILARELKALAASLPKPVKVNPSRPPVEVVRGDGEGESGDLPPMPMPSRDAEITEPEPEADDDDATLGDLTGNDDDADPTEDAEKPEGGQDADKPLPPQPGIEGQPAGDGEASKPGDDAGEDGETESEANEGANEPGGRGGPRPEPEPEPEPEQPAEDLTDATQEYDEANLNDLAAEAAKDAGKHLSEVQADAHHAATVLNIPLPRDLEITRGGDPKLASARIGSPAKLRRHLTMAVKSPERVSNERHQVSGRLDMRNLVGLATGASNVFKRRVEEEGREAAVINPDGR